MTNRSLSGVEAAAAAESEAERHGEKTQMVLDRKELAKYKATYKSFWFSLASSILSFLIAFVLLIFAVLLRREKPTEALVYAEFSVWYTLIFVVNTPRHLRVYGWFPPTDPRAQNTASSSVKVQELPIC